MQDLVHVSPTIHNTIGALLLAIVAAAVLFGITCLQAYLYFHRYPRDPKWQKWAVGTLWTLDVVHFALAMHFVYRYTVRDFNDRDLSQTMIWSLKAQVAVNVVIILIVQSLYTYRVWLLGGYHKGFGQYIAILVLCGGFALGISLAVKLAGLSYFEELDSISWAVCGSLASATVIDLAISCAMCYYLMKSRSPSEELNTKIIRLIHLTVTSGGFVFVMSVACLICYILFPRTLIFVALELLLTKIYVNSFLAMLNSRAPSSTPYPSQYESRGNNMVPLRSPPPVRSIQYEIAVVTQRDDEAGLSTDDESKTTSARWSDRTPNREPPTYAIGW